MSILFIVMVLMAFFMIASSDEKVVDRGLHEKEVATRDAKLAEQADLIALKASLVETLLAENAELKARLETAALEEDDLSARLAQLLARASNLENQNDMLLSENEAMRSALLRLEGRVEETKDLPAALDALREDNARLRDMIAELDGRSVVLKEEIARLEGMENIQLSQTLQRISDAREDLLGTIQERLAEAGINVQVDPVSGIIRFDESVIRFSSGSFKPDAEVEATMRVVSEILEQELQCYTLGPKSRIAPECNEHLTIVEAVQIEGHTDDTPMRPQVNLDGNLDLSAKRAASAYQVFIEHRPDLTSYQNASYLMTGQHEEAGAEGQPVLSVSGYGSARPVKRNAMGGQEANRRIDLRFIMTTPKTAEEADQLTKAIFEVTRGTVEVPSEG
jgi:flagellar motor protein MotB